MSFVVWPQAILHVSASIAPTLTEPSLSAPPPDHSLGFCPTGDSNLGDDYPSAVGYRWEYDDNKETKFVLNKAKKTVFMAHRGTVLGIDANGNVFLCAANDLNIHADGNIELLAGADIQIQAGGNLNLIGDAGVAMFSAEGDVSVIAGDALFLTAGSSIVENSSG